MALVKHVLSEAEGAQKTLSSENERTGAGQSRKKVKKGMPTSQGACLWPMADMTISCSIMPSPAGGSNDAFAQRLLFSPSGVRIYVPSSSWSQQRPVPSSTKMKADP